METVAWLAVLPTAIVALVNADIFRLVVGAFGPPPDTGLLRVLAIGAILAAGALILARSSSEPPALSARGRSAVLLAIALVVIVIVVLRSGDVRRHDVQFQGNGIHIGATIYEPRTAGPHPAFVFVAGSGPFKRGIYALWAEHLARRGIVAVVPDKRGVGGTGGEFERMNNTSQENLTLLAGDAVAALEFAAREPGVDSARLGLFGVSQAGWTAPMVAVASRRAKCMIIVTGPTVSVHEEGVWSDLRGDDERAAKMSRSEAELVLDTVAPRGVDARTSLAALNIPGLWLFGAEDASIPTRKSVVVLDSLAHQGKRFSFDSIPAVGHLVIGRLGGLLPRIAPSSWRTMDDWLSSENCT